MKRIVKLTSTAALVVGFFLIATADVNAQNYRRNLVRRSRAPLPVTRVVPPLYNSTYVPNTYTYPYGGYNNVSPSYYPSYTAPYTYTNPSYYPSYTTPYTYPSYNAYGYGSSYSNGIYGPYGSGIYLGGFVGGLPY